MVEAINYVIDLAIRFLAVACDSALFTSQGEFFFTFFVVTSHFTACFVGLILMD